MALIRHANSFVLTLLLLSSSLFSSADAAGADNVLEERVLQESSRALEDVDESGVPVESDACGPEVLALGCAEGAPCFSHSGGICLEDGTFGVADCEQAAPCAPCYPNSRCGGVELSVDETGVPVESDDCGLEVLELGCADAAPCFSHSGGICLEDGTFGIADCEQAAPCAPCFPNSRCGSGVDETGVPVESDDCGPEVLALGCADAATCFSHSGGICLEDGTFGIAYCEQAAPCATCFPNSRCGGVESSVDETGVPVESDACAPEVLALGCADAGPCFSHSGGICLVDGTFGIADCEQAAPCAPCFPNSRCGSGESSPATEDIDETGVPVESDVCGPEVLALGCAEGAPCFSHSGGICLEDGTFSVADCEPAAFCAPCYPNSRCGSLVEGEDGEEEEEEVAIGEEEEESSLPEVEGEDDPDSGAEPEQEEEEESEPEEEEESESTDSGATARGIVVASWLALLSVLSLPSMVIA